MIRKPSEMEVEVREQVRGGKEKVTIRHMFKKEEIKARTRLCAHLTMIPNSSIGTHPHVDEDELFVILKGTGIIDDGKTQTRVTAGDAILTGNGEAHAISNAGKDDLELIAIIMKY